MKTDYEALEPETFLPQAPGHHYALTGEFADLGSAERACLALHRAHVADGHVTVLGQLGEEVRTDWGLSFDDRIALGSMALRIGIGAVAGAALGGLLDLIATLVLMGPGTGAWAVTVAGAVLGFGVGGMVGGVSAMEVWDSQQRMHRRHPELDHAVVGVESEDPSEIDRAMAVLRELAPVRLDQLQPGGALA